MSIWASNLNLAWLLYLRKLHGSLDRVLALWERQALLMETLDKSRSSAFGQFSYMHEQ